ncbi:hypothetical protein BC628DRAFT_1377760 [Trametes gibbosa]|uniref:Zinc finger protein 224 n=1 Tax=Trametes gibbosa TaxID=160864 RepID=A0A6B9KKR6_9APHY|nr:hypothetical protein BC628DRAFT_1377760 [Trametes gibbosa]QHA24597.1 zinc finger protein 224 [Trametes gibbosa]QIE48558.1 hypothetical protein [Trametes gibbosa]
MIYVQYKQSKEGTVRDKRDPLDSSPSLSALESFWSGGSNATPPSTPASTPPRELRKRESSSTIDECPASPSDRFLKRPRTAGQSSVGDTSSERSTVAGTSADHAPRQKEMELQRSFHSLGIESDGSDVEIRNEAAVHSASHSDLERSPSANAHAGVDISSVWDVSPKRRAHEMQDEWFRYLQKVPDEHVEEGREWKCIWVDEEGAKCTYHAKKHLIKRHVEALHLKLRTWICPICGKGCSQKSALNTHLNTHTGATPHKCNYCEHRFKDPARRLRHMQRAHGYQSCRQLKKAKAAAQARVTAKKRAMNAAEGASKAAPKARVSVHGTVSPRGSEPSPSL